MSGVFGGVAVFYSNLAANKTPKEPPPPLPPTLINFLGDVEVLDLTFSETWMHGGGGSKGHAKWRPTV